MNISYDPRLGASRSAKIVGGMFKGWFAALAVLAMAVSLTAQETQIDSGSDDLSATENASEGPEQSSDALLSDALNPADEKVVNETKRWTSLPIANNLPDGRPLRPIGIYLSQIDELIPSHYRPVSIERLNEAIAKLTDRATDDQASRLKSAVYWVQVSNGRLVSDRSVIDLESDLAGEVRRSLGKVNLAIEQPRSSGNTPAIDVLPRLESQPDGNLVAVFRGDDPVHTGLAFKWRLRGKVLGSGHEYEMRIPRTPQTRIVVSAPSSLSIEAEDGVLRSFPNPPPDAVVTDPDLRWYEIEAGGLTNVRIRTRRNQSESEDGDFVIRKSTVNYQADPSGLTWNSPMVVQLPASRRFPVLAVSGTAFTAVKVNGIDVPYTTKTIGGREKHLQIELPDGFVKPQAVTVDVTVTGHTTWSDQNGWCDLPMPVWMGDGVVHASPVDNVQLDVFDPLRVMSWELPSDWKQAQEEAVENELTVLSAVGPPIAVPAESDDDSTSSRNWSRVRLVHRPLLNSSTTALQLDVAGESLNATARITVNIDPGRAEPLRMALEPGWSLDSVSYVHSGRVIEHSTVRENARGFVLWPEAEDADGSEIVIEAQGTKILSGYSGGLVIPPTWFLRTLDARGDFLAAIVPPENLNWSGDAALQIGRLESSQLTDSDREAFSGIDSNALWFRPRSGRTPEVTLETPSVSFNSATVLQIQRDPDAGQVTEQLVVEIDSPAQNLGELSIQTGPAVGRPPLQWSISGGKDSPSTSVPSSDVVIGEGENEGIYTLDISDKNFRGRQLVARRRYAIQPQHEIQLPSVPGAASQSSEVLVGPGLLVNSDSNAVQKVPVTRIVQAGDAEADDTSVEEPTIYSTLRLDDRSINGMVRLRYDAVQQPSVVLAKTDSDPNVTIVWREQIHVVASSRGSDSIEAMYKVSATTPLEIEYEPELQLASVSRDGEMVDLITIPQGSGDVLLGNRRIVLEPRRKTESIRIVWNRSQFGSSWIRRCRIPQITVSGTVLKSEYQLISSPDTFAPAALIRGQVSEGRFSSVDMRAGENATLVRRNIALAIGWLFALLLFAFSWFVAERAPLAVAAIVVLFAAIAVLWWPWNLAVIGWLIVPVVAAAMLATSRAWQEGASQAQTSSDASAHTRSSSGDSSSEFSLEALGRIMLLLLVVLGGLYGGIDAAVNAQESSGQPDTPANTRRAANVLVPVDEGGEFLGPVVYIPRSVHTQLFRTDRSKQPQEPRFQSASYRVKIDPAAKGRSRPSGMKVEAEYMIHVEHGDRIDNRVRLPLNYPAVLRVELLDDQNNLNLIRIEEVSGQVNAILPTGRKSFRLRVTLIPTVSDADQWTKLFLKIPPVAATELTVEAEQRLDALRVGGKDGSLLEETDLRRWVEDLGPAESLEIDFRTDSGASSSTPTPLQRRYWINAGKRHVTIDCEIDPPNVVAAGESFQFIVRDAVDASVPSLTSPHWRLDGSEAYSTTRRLITVTSTRDSPGPVRLLWTQPSTLNFVDESVPLPIRIPEVVAAVGDNAPAWVALNCDSALQFAPLTRDSTEPLSVDVFMAAWTGYRGPIVRAYVALEEIQSPILQIQPASPTTASQRHDLHVTPDRLELSFTAMLTPDESTAQRYTLRLPRGLQLVSVSANDRPLDGLPIRSGDSQEVMLGTFVGSEPVTISAVAVQSLPANRRFSPPRLAIVPSVSTRDLYTVSRVRSTTLRTIKAADVQPASSDPQGNADSLTRGWIPFASWRTESDEDSVELGTYEVKKRQTRFDCRQLIAVNREEMRWSMQTLIGFRTKRVPDFIDVEVPTRWCEGLEVSPTTAWSQQPATDPSRQIIRIRCDAEELRGQPLSIRGYLQTADNARVNVPSVRVLGLGPRRVHISVPSRLDSEPIQWRTSAVEAVRLPDQWNRVPSVTKAQRSTYMAANPSWSMELPDEVYDADDIEAIAACCDAQVFAKSDGVLVMCHWDLLPGSLDLVDVRLPVGSKCLGAWTAGQAVVAEQLDFAASTNAEPNTLRVPLSLSRFSQTIELLIRVPSSSAKRGNYLPELIDVPVTQQWVTNYVPNDSIRNSRLDRSLNEDRTIALAQSVVEAVEAVTSGAERPNSEVRVWFDLWLERYRSIARSAGHIVNFESMSEPNDSAWHALDARMLPFAKRFASNDSEAVQPGYRDAFTFGVSNYDGFVPERVIKLSAVNRPRPVQPVSSNDQGLRSLIVNVLTLILVGGILMILRPIHRLVTPVVTHPAFWLGLMGIFGFAVAPVPVAAAIVLVAVSLPVFPSRRPTSAGSAR